MTKELTAQFEVQQWEEQDFSVLDDGVKITQVHIKKSFTGAMHGVSELAYSMTYGLDGVAWFVGYESFHGELEGRSGRFVLQHKGQFKDGVASAVCEIIAGTSTGDLAGIQGEGSFAAKGRSAEFLLRYTGLT